MASKNREAYFSNYKSQSRWKSNREAKLLRQLELQPGNSKQIELAMSNMVYRRQTPQNPMWTSSIRKVAQLFKQFSGSAPHACFSSNPKVAQDAVAKLARVFNNGAVPQGKVDFSIGYRIANPAGPRR